jgi:hypothetical protein
MVGARLPRGSHLRRRAGDIESRYEFAGRVLAVSPLVSIERASEEPVTLPPDPEAYSRARPGEYSLASTGEVVVDPDYPTVWTVESPIE